MLNYFLQLKTVKRLSQSEMTSETRDLLGEETEYIRLINPNSFLVSEVLPLVLSSSSAMV